MRNDSLNYSFIRRSFAVVVSIATLAPGGAFAGDAPAAKGQAYALVVAGDGGEANFTENYKDWSVRFHKMLTGTCGIPSANVKVLLEKKELAPNIASGVSTKEEIVKAFGEFSAKLNPDDQFILIYIGHGTAQASEAKLCIPGPDITDGETAELLAKIKAKQTVFIQTAACSGAFLEKCSKPGRIVITATNGAGQGNETYFPEFFLQAYEKNKDSAGQDVLAAFNLASMDCPKWYLRQYYDSKAKTWRTEGKQSRALWEKFYGKVADKQEGKPENPDADDADPVLGEWGTQWASRRIPTENAQIDDNGDKIGTAVFVNNQFTPVAGSEEGADGFVSRICVLGKP